jgi:hypothetical protein
MANRTKLTPEIQERIVKAILAGNYFETACQCAKVKLKTAYEWLSRGEGNGYGGRKTSAVYAEFAEAVRRAEADAEAKTVIAITKGFPNNPRLALDFLARRHPERWGQRDTLTILQKLAGKVQGMTDEEVLAIVSRKPGSADPGEAGAGRGEEAGAEDPAAGTGSGAADTV